MQAWPQVTNRLEKREIARLELAGWSYVDRRLHTLDTHPDEVGIRTMALARHHANRAVCLVEDEHPAVGGDTEAEVGARRGRFALLGVPRLNELE